MKPTGADVAGLISRVPSAIRRRDAETLTTLMHETSERDAETWGTIIGFGSCHYRYPTGNEGDSPILGFAPRKLASTVYLLDGIDAHADALTRLGPYKRGAGCLYIKDLEEIDLEVLRGILKTSLAWVESGGSPAMELTVTG